MKHILSLLFLVQFYATAQERPKITNIQPFTFDTLPLHFVDSNTAWYDTLMGMIVFPKDKTFSWDGYHITGKEREVKAVDSMRKLIRNSWPIYIPSHPSADGVDDGIRAFGPQLVAPWYQRYYDWLVSLGWLILSVIFVRMIERYEDGPSWIARMCAVLGIIGCTVWAPSYLYLAAFNHKIQETFPESFGYWIMSLFIHSFLTFIAYWLYELFEESVYYISGHHRKGVVAESATIREEDDKRDNDSLVCPECLAGDMTYEGSVKGLAVYRCSFCGHHETREVADTTSKDAGTILFSN